MSTKQLQQSNVISHQFSYTTLSAFNKTVKSSFGSEITAQPSKAKIPFMANSSISGEHTPGPDNSPAARNIKWKALKYSLNHSLDTGPAAEKAMLKKTELVEKVKEIEEYYSELEGAKTFSKCFLSAMHSAEELIDDSESQYLFIKLLLLLHSNWKNFLELTQRNTQRLKSEVDKANTEMRSLRSAHETENKEWEEKYKKEKAKFEMKPLVQQFNLLKEKHHQMKINMERERKEMTSQISLLTVNNKNLADQVKQIQENADVLRTTATIQKLSNDLHQAQEMLKREKEEKSNMGFKLHTLLEATKAEVKERENIIVLKMREYDDLKMQYNRLKRELEDNKTCMKENLERMHMTNEDILQNQLKVVKLHERISEKKATIEEQKKKIQELEIQLKLQREGLVQKKEISMEGTLFYFVWDNPLARMNNQNKYSSRKDKSGVFGFGEGKKGNDKVADKTQDTGEVKLDSVLLGKYAYLRPTYRALIDELLPPEETTKVSYLPPFPVWLHVTVRAIFDSKLNELLLSYNKGKKISRFPEFVYSWLGTFCIDKDTRGIRTLEYTEKETVARENRCNLLLGLEAASAAKLWEINVFKEFLEEELGLDELAYFLHCRFILFKGPQLAIPTAGFCVTHFVTKEKVCEAIDRIMYAYSADDRKELKRKLVDFSKQTYKDSNAFDYAMVLRILLEFYRKEKKENFARFEELYTVAKRNMKTTKPILPFEDFYKILAGDYDKSITDLEVCNLYREAYVAGGCSITCDSTLLTFSETPFWIRYLRLKGQNAEPKYDARGDIDQYDDKGKECAAVYANWEQNEDFFEKVKKQLTECGAVEYLNFFDTMENYIRWKGKEDSAKHSGKSMLQVYRLMWIMVMELWTISEEKMQFNTDPEYKHEVSKEFLLFQQLKELYMGKIDKIARFDEKKKSAFAFEQNFAKMTQGTDLLSKIQSKIREDVEAPSAKTKAK